MELVSSQSQIISAHIYPMAELRRIAQDGSISYHPDEAVPAFHYEHESFPSEWMMMDLGYDLNDSH